MPKSNRAAPTKQTSTDQPAKSRLNPIKETFQTIRGYPETLVIYKSNASRFFWVRFYYNGKYRIKSTKCESPTDAKAFAVEFYKDTLINAVVTNTHDKRKAFEVLGHRFFQSTEKNSNKGTYRSDHNRYKQNILPEFKQQDIDTITNAQISQFVERLHTQKLSAATIKHHLVVLRKIMNFAISNDLMRHIPVFPRVKGRIKTNDKRDYFELQQYKTLVKAAERLAARGAKVYKSTVTMELKYLIQFMVNTFIRPSDLRVLQHKDIVEKSRDGRRWLELNHDATKTNAHPIQTMPGAVWIYSKICEHKTAMGQGTAPDDLVFFPKIKSRSRAIDLIGRQFREVVRESGLDELTGKHFTLYSLRHSAIMYRLIYGKVDSLALARNARTSPAMIDKFYAAHLTTDQVIDQLHAMPKPKPRVRAASKKPAAKKTAVKKTAVKTAHVAKTPAKKAAAKTTKAPSPKPAAKKAATNAKPAVKRAKSSEQAKS